MFKFILCAFLFISLNTYAAYQPEVSATIVNTIANPVKTEIVSGSITISTGALATAAKQDTGNTSLSSINSLLNIYLPSIDSNTSTFYALTNTQLRADHLNVSATQIGSWGSSITGVSTTTAMPVSIAGTLVVSQTGNSTVNQGTSPWVTSLASTTISSGTVALGSGSNLIGSVSGTQLSKIADNTPLLGQQLAAGSSPVVLTASQLSTLTPLSTVAVTQSTSPWVTSLASTTISSGTVALGSGSATIGAISNTAFTANAGTNLNTSALALDSTVAKDSSLSTLNTSVNTLLKPASTLAAVTTVGAVTSITNALPTGTNSIGQVTANAGTNLNTSAISGTVALNPNQSILSITSDYTPTSTVSSTDAINTSFTFRLSNTARTGFEAMNTTDATCWLRFSSSAATSATMTVILLPLSGYYNMPKPIYTGQINAICSANGTTGKLNNTEKP